MLGEVAERAECVNGEVVDLWVCHISELLSYQKIHYNTSYSDICFLFPADGGPSYSCSQQQFWWSYECFHMQILEQPAQSRLTVDTLDGLEVRLLEEPLHGSTLLCCERPQLRLPPPLVDALFDPPPPQRLDLLGVPLALVLVFIGPASVTLVRTFPAPAWGTVWARSTRIIVVPAWLFVGNRDVFQGPDCVRAALRELLPCLNSCIVRLLDGFAGDGSVNKRIILR